MKEAEILNSIIYNNNQFPEKTGIYSALPESIQHAGGFSIKDSLKYAKTHCNALVTYAIWFSQGLINITNTEFLAWGFGCGAINKFGFLEWTLEQMLAVHSPKTIVINHIMPFTPKSDKIYKMKIENDHGTHFMGAYNIGTTWFLSDPNDRGVGVTWDSLKNGDRVINLKEFV